MFGLKGLYKKWNSNPLSSLFNWAIFIGVGSFMVSHIVGQISDNMASNIMAEYASTTAAITIANAQE